MKIEEQVQYSPTKSQTMVLLQRDYYNGTSSEDGSLQFTAQACHPGERGPLHTLSEAETNNAHQIFVGFSAFPSFLRS